MRSRTRWLVFGPIAVAMIGAALSRLLDQDVIGWSGLALGIALLASLAAWSLLDVVQGKTDEARARTLSAELWALRGLMLEQVTTDAEFVDWAARMDATWSATKAALVAVVGQGRADAVETQVGGVGVNYPGSFNAEHNARRSGISNLATRISTLMTNQSAP